MSSRFNFFQKSFAVLVLGLTCLSGCTDETRQDCSFRPVFMVDRSAERTMKMTVGACEREVSFTAKIAYPSPYGLDPEEQIRLVAFVDSLMDNGTNFVTTVDRFANAWFSTFSDAVRLAPRLSLKGQQTLVGTARLTTPRCFSYELELRGFQVSSASGVYDRQLKRPLELADLVKTENFGQLRQLIGRTLNAPVLKDEFSFRDEGVRWVYTDEETRGLGLVEVIIPWNDLKPIIADAALLPDDSHVSADGHVKRLYAGEKIVCYCVEGSNLVWRLDRQCPLPIEDLLDVHYRSRIQDLAGSEIPAFQNYSLNEQGVFWGTVSVSWKDLMPYVRNPALIPGFKR